MDCEPGYNPATTTAARLRTFGPNGVGPTTVTTAQLPIPVKSVTTAVVMPQGPQSEDEDMLTLAKLLGRVVHSSFVNDIRGVEDVELAHVQDILVRFCEAGAVARAAIDSEIRHRTVAEILVKDHPDFACPISHVMMRDPVVAADGHSYERLEIENHFANGSMRSPLDGDELRCTTLIANRNLKREIERAMSSLTGEPDPGADKSGGSGGSMEATASKRQRAE